MATRSILVLGLFLCSIFCNGQTLNLYDEHVQDSLCTYGKKYVEPAWRTISFPAEEVSDSVKISALHKALPDSFNNEDNDNWWYYQYYWGDGHLTNYDPVGDSTYIIKDKLDQILKDTYFFDINGDGLLDFIHYPRSYKAIAQDMYSYEFFLQQKIGYKMITFAGYIVDIHFGNDGTLDNMKTFFPECCDNNQCRFLYYRFNRKTNTLESIRTDAILACQLIRSAK